MVGPEPQARDGGQPSPDDIHAYVARLLASSGFAASPRRRKLLDYVVEQTLAGRAERLKAYDLALSVLGRDERFDPQNDPIVRIEVGRLRRDLDHYYEADGKDDPIRITIPKGHYVPAFEVRATPTLAPPERLAPARQPVGFGHLRRARWPAAAGLLALTLIGVVAAWSWSGRPTAQSAGPALIVVPFEGLSSGEEDELLATGLSNGLITDLMRFDALQVFAAKPGDDGRAPLPAAAADAPAYIVTGGVERGADRVRVTARLTDRQSGEVVWSQRFDRALSAGDIIGLEDELVAGIAGRLAQVYGVINAAAARSLTRSRPGTLFAYDCVQRAFAYRRTFANEQYPSVRACLEESVRRDPGYAGAWAMLAFAHMDAVRYGLVEPAVRQGELDAGLAAARRAVELAPQGVRGHQSLAALLYARGEFAEAERVQRQAIALNPHDPESLAQLGWRLMARGSWDEGARLLQEAIDRTLVAPSWYHLDLAFALYLCGDYERARDAAELSRGSWGGFDYAALAMTEAALGHAEAARRALDEALRLSPVLARDPVEFWTRFQVAPEVIERFNAGLSKAGLAPSSDLGDTQLR